MLQSPDNVPYNYYEEQYYMIAQIISYLSIAICALGWLSFFISLYTGKIIGI